MSRLNVFSNFNCFEISLDHFKYDVNFFYLLLLILINEFIFESFIFLFVEDTFIARNKLFLFLLPYI